MTITSKHLPNIVNQAEWQTALDIHLVKEKELTRARDALNAERRKLPMTPVTKSYRLEGGNGPTDLLALFEGRQQLIVYHFMFAPDWEAGCEGCSWVMDAMTHPAHLHARDTTLVMVSRAPLDKLIRYKARMGWTYPIPWYSSFESDFNDDFGASTNEGEVHGVSVFIRDGEDIYRTFYTGGRGIEQLGSFWSYLDLTPYGRQENWEESPHGWAQTAPYSWIRRHDEYTSQQTEPAGHKSQLGCIIIDCKTDDFERDTTFWANVFGSEIYRRNKPGDENFRLLSTSPSQPRILLQKVDHPSRVHLDIESDNIDREVQRLKEIGAKEIDRLHGWCVMEAPSGHRFCVIKVNRQGFDHSAKQWD